MKNFVHQFIQQSLLVTATFLVSLPVFAHADNNGEPKNGQEDFVTNCDCPDNLVKNPSFENGTTDWGWWGGNFYSDTYAAQCGAKSGQLQITSGWGKFYQQIASGNLQAGTTISVSVYAGSHNPWNYAHYLGIEYYTSSGTFISKTDVAMESTLPNMGYYTINSTIPSGAGQIYVYGEGNGDWIKTDMWCVNYTSCNPNSSSAPPFCAPTPNCSGSNKFLWSQSISEIDGNPSAVRFYCGGANTFTIPGPYPAAFGSTVTINIDEAIGWDGYAGRNSVSQPNEKYKVVFFKNGSVVGSSNWSGDVPDNVTQGYWSGGLGSVTLPNGCDQIRLIHWSNSTYGTGDCGSPNSLVPSSVCFSYSTCDNATDGGTIAASQTGCSPFDPVSFTNVTSPSGGSGALEIIWIQSTTNCPPASFDGAQWTTISGATGLTYDPGALTQTTCFRRCARRAGCTDYNAESNIVTVTVKPALTFTTTVTQPTCAGGTNGKIQVDVTGGTTPNYSYNWTKVGGGSGSASNIPSEPFNITGLSAGTYNLTVTNGNNCTATATVTISNPTAFAASVYTKDNVTCNGGSDGQIGIDITAGFASPYSYTWSKSGGGSGSGSSSTEPFYITGLTAGTYTVTITNNNGCTTTGTATVNQPSALSLTRTVTNVSCAGGSNGAIDLTVSGGTSPYTYDWSNDGPESPDNDTQDLSGLSAGTYTVTVTDASGCTATTSATVTVPAALSLTRTVTNVSCAGGSNGAIDLTVSGGTTPYTYDWSNDGPESPDNDTQDLSGLSAGTYTVTVTDANGCTATSTATVTAPPALSLTRTVTNVSCAGGSNGAIDLTVSGGTTPYTYDWSNDGPESPDNDPQDLSGLTAGTYTVTVTDANGCTGTTTATVTAPSALSLSVTTTGSTCGQSNGSVDLTVSGGTTPYTYDWSNDGPESPDNDPQDLSGLSAGTYTVTVTDANNCTATTTATVSSANGPTLSVSVTNVSCAGGSNGAIDLTVTGGTAPITYDWSNDGAENPDNDTQDLSGLSAGTYTVTVTDANGCTATTSATISQPNALSLSVTTTGSTCGQSNGSVDLTVSGGTTPYTYDWSNDGPESPDNDTQDLSGLSAGTFTVTVTDANGCTATTTATVSSANGPTLSTTKVDVLCFGGSNGSIDLTVTGGTAPITYDWSNDGPESPDNDTQDLSGLTAGTYTV
ncbi:MAG: SprB repeat-containing protein, partial [Saprospiraceae bacterium]|nr:SprB repeat-containing protein [Saprospiraceae bacterium]